MQKTYTEAEIKDMVRASPAYFHATSKERRYMLLGGLRIAEELGALKQS